MIVNRCDESFAPRTSYSRCAVFVEGGALVDRQNLAEHAVDGFDGEDTRGELDLAPGQRAAELTGRLGCRHDVRLFAHVHDESIAVEAHYGVE